jgi:hypothetical protein
VVWAVDVVEGWKFGVGDNAGEFRGFLFEGDGVAGGDESKVVFLV